MVYETGKQNTLNCNDSSMFVLTIFVNAIFMSYCLSEMLGLCPIFGRI